MKNLVNKIENIHLYFKTSSEKEAVCDFANCLKKRICEESDFATAYKKAADDLRNQRKVPETYDKATISWIKDLQSFIHQKIFGERVV